MPPRTACGSAFVRRMIRVGTGWRLSCARGGKADALARGASAPRGASRFKPGRAHGPPGTQGRLASSAEMQGSRPGPGGSFAAAHGCGPLL
jgi:hypothetical protein